MTQAARPDSVFSTCRTLKDIYDVIGFLQCAWKQICQCICNQQQQGTNTWNLIWNTKSNSWPLVSIKQLVCIPLRTSTQMPSEVGMWKVVVAHTDLRKGYEATILRVVYRFFYISIYLYMCMYIKELCELCNEHTTAKPRYTHLMFRQQHERKKHSFTANAAESLSYWSHWLPHQTHFVANAATVHWNGFVVFLQFACYQICQCIRNQHQKGTNTPNQALSITCDLLWP